jgi:glycosyltransferase involved in cell wall biosynthesis
VHQHFGTNAGTASTRTYDFARYLAGQGHRVTVVTGRYHGSGLPAAQDHRLLERLEVDGVRVVRLPVDYGNAMGFAARVASFLEFAALSSYVAVSEPGQDLVYASSTPITVGIPALLARLLRGRPYSFEVRDLWPDVPIAMGVIRNPVLIAGVRLAERTFYRFARRVVGVSEGLAGEIGAKGVPGERLRVVYTGVDLGLFDAVEPDREALRRAGLEGKLVAVYAGAHSTANACQVILGAAAHLKADPRVAFLMVGEGRTKAELQEQARREGLANLVFLPGRPKAQVPALLKACDVGLITGMDVPEFRWDMSNKFFDYLAAGLPILTNVGEEQARHLEQARCGFKVPPDDPAALAERLAFLADHPRERQAMGQRARELARRRFDRQALARELEQVLLETRGAG